VAAPVEFYRRYIDDASDVELVRVGTATWIARPGDGEIQQRVELSDNEVVQARELTRSSRCDVKMWYVPTGSVSEGAALALGAQIFDASSFRLERVGNAFLFHG
jgi:hypothetical protein